MTILRNLDNLGTSCPSQWFARDEHGNQVYIRYRYGYLSVSLYGENIELWGARIGDNLDGVLSTRALLAVLPPTISVVSFGSEDDDRR